MFVCIYIYLYASLAAAAAGMVVEDTPPRHPQVHPKYIYI